MKYKNLFIRIKMLYFYCWDTFMIKDSMARYWKSGPNAGYYYPIAGKIEPENL